MIFNIDNPQVDDNNKSRKDGISAFLRVKNGEDFLEISIKSIIHEIDELICVVNNSSDRTIDILLSLQKNFPNKIFIYNYIPFVYPPGSKEYTHYPITSHHSLVYYYNFALSKTNYKYIFKFDDDEIFFPKIIEKIYKLCNNEYVCFGLKGINLIDINKKLFVHKHKYRSTPGKDTLFFRYDKSCKFTKGERCENFISNHIIKDIITCFYHLKFCKSDRGQNNYLLNNNDNSEYIDIGKNFLNSLKRENLITIEEYIKIYELPDPIKDMYFTFIDESKKKYEYFLYNTIEKHL